MHCVLYIRTSPFQRPIPISAAYLLSLSNWFPKRTIMHYSDGHLYGIILQCLPGEDINVIYTD